MQFRQVLKSFCLLLIPIVIAFFSIASRSVCDITSKSSYPTRTEGTAVYTTGAASVPGLNSGAGFLTYLFEAEDTVNLDLGISYAYTGILPPVFESFRSVLKYCTYFLFLIFVRF